MDKKFILTFLIVIGAIIFVPLIPNDVSLNCDISRDGELCNDTSAYISVYQKYFH